MGVRFRAKLVVHLVAPLLVASSALGMASCAAQAQAANSETAATRAARTDARENLDLLRSRSFGAATTTSR